jgi:hypothetical protein
LETESQDCEYLRSRKKTRVRKGRAENTFPEEVPYLVVGMEAAGKFLEDIFVLEVSLL